MAGGRWARHLRSPAQTATRQTNRSRNVCRVEGGVVIPVLSAGASGVRTANRSDVGESFKGVSVRPPVSPTGVNRTTGRVVGLGGFRGTFKGGDVADVLRLVGGYLGE